MIEYSFLMTDQHTEVHFDTTEEFNVDSKAECVISCCMKIKQELCCHKETVRCSEFLSFDCCLLQQVLITVITLLIAQALVLIGLEHRVSISHHK